MGALTRYRAMIMREEMDDWFARRNNKQVKGLAENVK
jgi:hypothetical protein